MEKWIDIKGYEGIYEVSNLGRVRTHKNKTTSNKKFRIRKWKQRILKQKPGKKSGFRVDLWKEGKPKTFLVARLVAFNFLNEDIENEKLTVNHMDGNRKNNNIENLELVSLKENIQHGFRTGLYERSTKKIRLNDNVFQSYASADRWLGRKPGYISGCIKFGRKIKSVKGEEFNYELL